MDGILVAFRDGVVGAAIEAVAQHLCPGRRTGHNAAQQAERGPVVDALFAFGCAIGGDELACEVERIVEELAIGRAQLVGNFARVAMREGRVFAHPFQHVTAAALDEMASEQLALLGGRGGHVERLEFRVQQAE